MLSIIIPVYNVERFLRQCLASVEEQTSNNFEVIIVNDGSTDNSEGIIVEFCDRNNNFSYYTKENGGLMSAYLFGIEKAKGDYIGFIDSDDYVSLEFVEKIYDSNIEKADVVICDRQDVAEDGSLIYSEPFNVLPFGLYEADNNDIIYRNIFPPFTGKHITNARWNKIFKKEIVLDNLKYCESKSRIMEDRFFTPSCMFSSSSFKFIPDVLYFYRQRKSGSNHSMASPKLYATVKLLMETQRQMLVDKNIYDKYKNEYELACLNYMGLFIERNLLINQPFSSKKIYSKQIIEDDDFQRLVRKYKKQLVGKKGFAIKVSFYYRSALILSLFTLFYRS